MVDFIDRAINDFTNITYSIESLQTRLDRLATEALEAGQELVENEVRNVLADTVSLANAGLMCQADFWQSRVRERLLELKADLTNSTYEPSPGVCWILPDILRAGSSVDVVRVYGYNLETESVSVTLADGGGSTTSLNHLLSSPSPYWLVLNVDDPAVQQAPRGSSIQFRLRGGQSYVVPIQDRARMTATYRMAELSGGQISARDAPGNPTVKGLDTRLFLLSSASPTFEYKPGAVKDGSRRKVKGTFTITGRLYAETGNIGVTAKGELHEWQQRKGRFTFQNSTTETTTRSPGQKQSLSVEVEEDPGADEAKLSISVANLTPHVFWAERDSYVRADHPIRENDNYGCELYMNVGTGRRGKPDRMRSLIKFDVSTIPAAVNVRMALLELHYHSYSFKPVPSRRRPAPPSRASRLSPIRNLAYRVQLSAYHRALATSQRTDINTPFTVSVHALTQDWNEGDGAENELLRTLVPEFAVGTDQADGVAWRGLDPENRSQPTFEPEAVSVREVDPRIMDPGTSLTWDVTSIVQDWVNRPSTNHGLVLRDEISRGDFRELRFGSRESDSFIGHEGAVAGPRLIVLTA